MKPAERSTRTQILLTKIQECETEAHALGLVITAHTLNNAKNACGWEAAGEVEQAAAASKGIRHE